MLAKIMRYDDSELDLTEWEHCVICVANIMIKMITRGGLDFDEENQIWDRTPLEAAEPLQSTSVIQAGEGSDTSKGDGSKGKKKKKNKGKKRNRNRGKPESQPSSFLVLSDQPTGPTTESALYTLDTTTVAMMPPDLLVGTPSLLSRHSVDGQDVAAEISGALTLSKIMNVADIQPSDEHQNKKEKASSRERGESGTATEGTPVFFEHRGKTSRTSCYVRADIDAVP
jgi:hypothetical protein